MCHLNRGPGGCQRSVLLDPPRERRSRARVEKVEEELFRSSRWYGTIIARHFSKGSFRRRTMVNVFGSERGFGDGEIRMLQRALKAKQALRSSLPEPQKMEKKGKASRRLARKAA
jgi:hypothetical protein